MEVVWDVENKVTFFEEFNEKGKKTTHTDLSPFNPANYLVSVGAAVRGYARGWKTHYWFLAHEEIPEGELDQRAIQQEIQWLLDQTTVFIAHNAKYDLQWLWAAGFKYEGLVYDTMLGEYVWARGQKDISLSLKEAALRRGLPPKRTDLTEEYWNQGIGFDAMPLDVVETYGRQDCDTTGWLYDSQAILYYHKENYGLTKTRRLMNEFCYELALMEYNGIHIDLNALDAVEKEFRQERVDLIEKLNAHVRAVMGDRITNLDSPEQMSMVIFSRVVTDKRNWGDMWLKDGNPINRRMGKGEFKKIISDKCYVLNKQKSSQCPICKGTGKVFKVKKDGGLFKKATKCPECDAVGLKFKDLPEVAGFKFNPPDANWVTANGFATDKEHIEVLVGVARSKGMKEAEDFLQAVIRLNAVNTYLDSFINGIKRNTRHDALLHAAFNQTRTSTGRLSSSGPNMQNMPRGSTFPVKRAFTSRFAGGKICEGDFSQLEFRSAGELSGCEQVANDIREGVDVHAQTAKAITDAGQPINRQEAKPRTFRPLYGGTTGTAAEMAYIQFFMRKYDGVARWHGELQEQAIALKKIVLPTGREYAFPYAKRNYFGGSTNATKIKNYPVQGFATADIVPWACIRFARLLRKHTCLSVLINTVHDSIVADVHPSEFELVPRFMHEAMTGVVDTMYEVYGIRLKIPLAVEIKLGDNWLTGERIY